jgi:hypothetical protein
MTIVNSDLGTSFHGSCISLWFVNDAAVMSMPVTIPANRERS